jgi:hypothetical protein
MKLLRLGALLTAEWLMVLPGAALFMMAILRQLQPRTHEPSRTIWLISDWAVSQISRAGAAVIFLGLPALACSIAGIALSRAWRRDPQLRQDVTGAVRIVRRNFAVAVLASAAIVAAAILAASVVHIITD